MSDSNRIDAVVHKIMQKAFENENKYWYFETNKCGLQNSIMAGIIKSDNNISPYMNVSNAKENFTWCGKATRKGDAFDIIFFHCSDLMREILNAITFNELENGTAVRSENHPKIPTKNEIREVMSRIESEHKTWLGDTEQRILLEAYNTPMENKRFETLIKSFGAYEFQDASHVIKMPLLKKMTNTLSNIATAKEPQNS